MPLKIDIQTNINDYELTLETCLQIITMLQDTYKNIRKEMYNHFLGKKSLNRSLIIVAVLFIFYIISKDTFFVYLMPISVIISMVTSIISAEYLTSQTRKQIHEQIQHYVERKNRLISDQKIKV